MGKVIVSAQVWVCDEPGCGARQEQSAALVFPPEGWASVSWDHWGALPGVPESMTVYHRSMVLCSAHSNTRLASLISTPAIPPKNE